jgi:hypothetical protein
VIQVVYRATPAGNVKARPPWFSKWVCLGSLLRAIEEAGRTTIDVRFLCDGNLPDAVLDLMAQYGETEHLSGLGNSGSYLRALEWATKGPLLDSDSVYFVEDDYVHVEGSLAALDGAIRATDPGSYLTLYDHPDRYGRTDDLVVPGRSIELINGRHWRRVESTNMTFAANVRTLRRDGWLFRAFARHTSYPHDRELWRAVQGLGARRPLRWMRGRRVLLGPIPSLATHAERETLAPGVDWEAVAIRSRNWLATGAGSEDVEW